MKPHEETWVAENAGNPKNPTAVVYVLGEDGAKRPFLGAERMRLAAQAPAMARWMLRLRTGILSEGHLYEDSPFWQIWGPELEAIIRDAGVIP